MLAICRIILEVVVIKLKVCIFKKCPFSLPGKYNISDSGYEVCKERGTIKTKSRGSLFTLTHRFSNVDIIDISDIHLLVNFQLCHPQKTCLVVSYVV